MNAQKRLPFWLRQWYKHALVLKQVDHNEKMHGHAFDVLCMGNESLESSRAHNRAAYLLQDREDSSAVPDMLISKFTMGCTG
mgnify:CR=1 FL=1